MSVRAYRVIRVETEREPSFNLWHDEIFMKYVAANTEFSATLNADGCGFAALTSEDLEAIAFDAKKDGEYEKIRETVETVKADLQKAGAGDVEYLCY